MVTGKEDIFKNTVGRITENYSLEGDMPVFCGEMTLPDRQEIIHILNEIEKILFPS